MPGITMNQEPNGESKKRSFEGKMINAPSTASAPKIVHIAQEAYHPLKTYNELLETLQNMAELPLVQQTNENADANKRKKLLLMKFAQDNRAKFIKLLKAAADVSKLIDIFSWAREQNDHMDFLFSSAAGERNPDIPTALAIMSTGKASWMPTLGYIPPEPIPSEQALKLLRYMNSSLSIRLNVHENLPRRLQNWRIQSGRATFVIENELEFDVVSFWWFVDVRLLFSPAPSIANQADFILREKGLGGLFDFLCNFILTHKISVLRSQALRLASSGWAGSLKVEKVHRELVVSYWVDRLGKKNWVEIGISNNKSKNAKSSWRGPALPSLTTRWFRQGVEVKDVNFDFDWKDLSFERVIKRVVAHHTNETLRATQELFNSQISANASLSKSEPADCKLDVTLGPSSNLTSLCLEPVTGSYILQPATSLSAKAEYAFNQGREPKQIANILTQLLAQTLRDFVQTHAQQLGWHTVMRQSLHIDVVRSAVKLDILQYVMYSPRGWSLGWCLAAVIDVSGCSWWILQIGSNGTAIDHAEQIKMSRPDGSTLNISRNTLASIERVGVQLLSTRVTARQLEREKKPFSLRYEFGQAKTAAGVRRVARSWALYMNTADLLKTQPDEEPWLESSIAVICQGLSPEGGNVWHIAAGRMVKDAAADMQKLMAASPQSGFKFAEDGNFRILLSTPFGEDILGELRARLRDVNRLRSFATTLQKRQMRLGSSSLQRVQFQYGPSPHTAAVNFSAEKEITVEMSHHNPHSRIHKLLTEIANERVPSLPSIFVGDKNGLDRLCTILVLTRPLVSALNALEIHTGNTNLRNPAIHVHSLFKCRITYENPVCTFDIRVQPKEDKVYWFIEDSMRKHSHAPDLRPSSERKPNHRRLENLQAKLQDFFASKGQRYFGTRNGLIANIDGVGEALQRLNDVVLSCTMEGGYKPPPPLKTHQQQVNTQQRNSQQQITHRLQQLRQQQHTIQQQAQGQGRAQQQQQSMQHNSRPSLANGQQHQQPRQLARPGSRKEPIDID
ncbi:mediator complex subunit MED14-domain-containing protein [Phaeosphaeriaceae sp. PMI808]|nr:mediator complex subunit MED14-domain-containing protein [Phaeosphaeriaceae sp. PMI808]